MHVSVQSNQFYFLPKLKLKYILLNMNIWPSIFHLSLMPSFWCLYLISHIIDRWEGRRQIGGMSKDRKDVRLRQIRIGLSGNSFLSRNLSMSEGFKIQHLNKFEPVTSQSKMIYSSSIGWPLSSGEPIKKRPLFWFSWRKRMLKT